MFGEGAATASIMLVGEQPGDREDRAGRPFVGPAGRILDQALERAGIDRERVFVTNVVKHFKWRPSGKRRLHERPTRAEVRACRPWLEEEFGLVRPDAIVLLGATAGQALFGPGFRVTSGRGRPLDSDLALVVIAIHPSAVLRSRDPEEREAAFAGLVSDLQATERALDGAASRATR